MFVGRFEGLAAWLIERAGRETTPPIDSVACGLEPADWTAAIVDSYALDTAELCELAEELPIATLGEARRCEEAGVVIDYHLDLIGRPPSHDCSLGRPTRRSIPRSRAPDAAARLSRRCS